MNVYLLLGRPWLYDDVVNITVVIILINSHMIKRSFF